LELLTGKLFCSFIGKSEMPKKVGAIARQSEKRMLFLSKLLSSFERTNFFKKVLHFSRRLL
uniref:hypothetical protein n=1 Tax=Bacillus sp. CGMCC 1.16541 TaxID=2185143 RepID=UPI0019514062